MVQLQSALIEDLRSKVKGEVLLPADAGFDNARSIWNAMIDRKPALIVRCKDAEDVQLCVALARDNGMLLSVKGAGHGIAGNAVCDNGLMIDLSAMKSVRVNPETRRAYVEPGATLAEFDEAAQAYGLATPLGINSTTGVAGLTLGGGFGWLTRKYGMTIDNLLAAELVTAAGERVRANAQENPDLFWAIRGGGGNFGVITQFEFQLHPVGPQVLSGLVVFPFSQAKTLLTKYRELVSQIPEELNLWTILRLAPPLPFLPEAIHGTPVVVFPFVYVGEIEAGMRAIEPLRDLAQPVGEHIGPQPYTSWQKAFDPLLTPGARNYWKSHNFTELSDGAIDTMIDYAAKFPSNLCEIFVGLISGQANRIPEQATAYAHRATNLVMNVHARWELPKDDAACIGWARDFFRDTTRYASGGGYVNFMTQDEIERTRSAYGENYQRLVQLKKKFDPGNLFRMNQNIEPGA